MHSARSKAAIGLGIFLLVVLFARTLPGARSRAQQDFDEWLGVREQAYVDAAQRTVPRGGGDRINLPMISLEIVPADRPTPARFVLGQGADPERILRLLVLMRESNIFTIGGKSGQSGGPGSFTLKVQEGGALFESRFGQQDVEDNVQARTMLKLFEQFAVPLDTLEDQGGKV